MAYYQSEDPGYPRASYSSRPLDSFEEPSSPARSRGPVLFLLFCVAAIAAVWTLATADSSNPNISIRADSDDTTDAYMQALNLVRAMHEKAAAQGEQGLEDIEDLDEVESPPASSDDPSVDSDSSHFMSCLERSCSPSMYDVAAANPSGSQLLQCLSSAPDGVTATACWAPESDDAQGTPTHLTFETEEDLDAEQTVRICAVCNGCIPGSVGPNE